MSNEVQVVFALYEGNKESRSFLSTAIHSYCKGKALRVKMNTPVEFLAGECLNIPLQTFQKVDAPLQPPIQVQEGQIRRFIHKIHSGLVDKNAFNPNKIGVSNFRRFLIKSPEEALRFAGFEMVRKIYPDYVPMVALKSILGKVGTFIIDGVKFSNEFAYLENMFQLVFPIRLKGKKKKEEELDDYAGLREDLSEIITPFMKVDVSNMKEAEEAAKSVCVKVEEEVSKRIEAGDIKPMVIPESFNSSTSQQQTSSGDSFIVEKGDAKAVFSKKEHRWTDDEVQT
jgi:hypothetical protein